MPQVATSPQSFVVSAASAGPVLVQQQVSLGTASPGAITLTLAAAPTAGNTLVMYAVGTNTGDIPNPDGWTLVSNTFAGATTGRRFIYKRTADGTEGTTITSPAFAAGSGGFAVQEWQGSVAVTAAEGGQTTAASSAFSVGPFAAPSANAVPAAFAMFNGSSAMPPWTWGTGWTAVGPLANGNFPSRGQGVGYGTATAGAVSAVPVTYVGTRGNAVVVLWLGAWIS